jgi:hypothetical protein
VEEKVMKKVLCVVGSVILCSGVSGDNTVQIQVTAKVPAIFGFAALRAGRAVELLKEDARELTDEASNRTILLASELTGQGKLTIISANGDGERCRVSDGGDTVRYQVFLRKGDSNVELKHRVSVQQDFIAYEEFSLIFTAVPSDFVKSGATYGDTLTVEIAAP